MLSVVCWRWRPHPGYRSQFGPHTVNVLRRMVARHYPQPHRFICVTDDPRGLDPAVEVVPLWPDYATLPNPSGHPRNPSCWRRLKAFAAEAVDWFGPRFVSLDLDVVITGDVTPLWERPEEFVIWADTNGRTLYNGSMFLLTAGARRQVWDTFDPARAVAACRRSKQFGSDQAWIGACLGPQEARWTKQDGVLSFRNDLKEGQRPLPPSARLVCFHGHVDPWSASAQRLPWVREAYQ